ncbi:MAG: hypothetical protein LUF35_04335 [Lachnospiraceae bacterium]|nr:hypothetical protein [Lachnospiraceae bacterium]
MQIIVYLRRQDLFLTSLWNQKVKKGKTSEPLPLFVKHHMEEKPLYTDYDQTLTRLADIFGADALIVRRYETASWVNQSICDDFLTAVGLDCSLPFVSSKETPANLSLSESAAEIQRIVNSADFLSPEEKQRFAKIRNELPQSVSPQSKALNFPERHLSVKEADSVLAHFKEGNNHVAQVWFSDGKPLFSESITAPAIRQRLSSEELSDDIIYFFLSVTHDLYMQNQELSHWARPFMHITRILRHPLAAIRHLL